MVLATTNLPETTCVELKTVFFGKVKADELKHSALQKRKPQQKMVLEFLRYVDHHEYFKLSATLTRFALVAKDVDVIVEPVAYEDGLNFYKDGLSRALANLIYFTTPHS